MALAVYNFARVEEVGHLVLSPEVVVSVTSFFVVGRFVSGDTVLLALSRWFLVLLCPFHGRRHASRSCCRPGEVLMPH